MKEIKFCVVLEEEEKIEIALDVWACIWCMVCIQVYIPRSLLLPYH